MQKDLFIDLQQHFASYCNTLPVFGFNSSKYSINFIESHLLPTLVNERDIEPIINKSANNFVSFESGDVLLLDILKFLGASILDSFLKAHKPSERKRCFPSEGFNRPHKLINRNNFLTKPFTTNYVFSIVLEKSIGSTKR